MSAELYEHPKKQISQGDIFELVPHIGLAPPLLALERESETILRGSVEPFPRFDDKNGQLVAATCKRTRGILITHSCEIDKPQVREWQFCPVVPIHILKPETQARVRGNKIFSMLHLPRHWDVLPESFIDFNHISTIDKQLVVGLRKLTSLSEMGLRALYAQYFRWLTRWELREITCPQCGVIFDPTQSLTIPS